MLRGNFGLWETRSGPAGKVLEAVVRLIGERLDMHVEWTGRGADRGQDLIFVETQRGPIKAASVRWLVS
jgi:hypothetical protein